MRRYIDLHQEMYMHYIGIIFARYSIWKTHKTKRIECSKAMDLEDGIIIQLSCIGTLDYLLNQSVSFRKWSSR